jgi:hypothetical protein
MSNCEPEYCTSLELALDNMKAHLLSLMAACDSSVPGAVDTLQLQLKSFKNQCQTLPPGCFDHVMDLIRLEQETCLSQRKILLDLDLARSQLSDMHGLMVEYPDEDWLEDVALLVERELYFKNQLQGFPVPSRTFATAPPGVKIYGV